ncbi:heparinase II/III domain-containing protein [Geminisphaera colitermitum]|uniref:heparinase II/III domain-containing protein n=1 Tax=Geminisphaera colitermitum TaxID=1148786 RepID=UPI0009DF4D3E|nr:heparinase II/III family protein [Geminisphaera colitermitum]
MLIRPEKIVAFICPPLATLLAATLFASALLAVTTSLSAQKTIPADRKLPAIEPARVTQITEWLSPRPTHFTPTFDDRSFWTPLATLPTAKTIITKARKFAREPIPDLPDALYLEFQNTGRRESYERPFTLRSERLNALVFAAGLTNDTVAWLPPIEAELAAILDEPTWAIPAGARSRKTRTDAYDYVDLAATARAWTLASADWLLGDRLQPATRARIRQEIHARVLAPWLARVRARDRRDFWWMSTDNNWNAVCNTGVLGTALTLTENPAERARFIAAYEALTPFFLAGFADDGFCHEGIGYWVYGFGHYLIGAELIRQTTAGHVDLLAAPKVARIATFASGWEICPGIYPAFGDARMTTRVSPWLSTFVASRFATPPPADVALPQFRNWHSLGVQLYASLFELAEHAEHATPSSPPPAPPANNPGALAPRNWFPDGGALVARSIPAATGLSLAIKGGHNGQPHNHNDLGSFVVVNDGVLVMSDLGVDAYTKDTFGPRRYTSGVMNSFGHPVPRVAGQLQKTGPDARAVTVRTEFTDERDVWEMDLTSAYDVPALKQLTRTFTFTRANRGRLEIVDRVRHTTPQTFGTALILLPGQQRSAAHASGFRLTSGGKAVDIAFHADGGDIVLREEPVSGIIPDAPPKGTRVGLELLQPTLEAEIRLVITPANDP